jgi:hypothetical protein
MMTALIARLRTLAPSFAGRIVGAADEAGVLTQQIAVLPAAFVYPIEDTVEPPLGDYHLCQRVIQCWGVIAVLDATADTLGQAAVADAFGILREEIWAACLGWQPAPLCDPISYAGAKVLKRDAARLWVGFALDAPRLLTDRAGEPDELDPFERFMPVYGLPTTTIPGGADHIELPQD